MKRMTRGLVLALVLAAMSPSTAPGQIVATGERQCPEGVANGTLGISGWDCRGECTLTLNEKGEEQYWSFTVEPRITGITRGGPAEGILRTNDVLVAIDGFLVTTSEGGRRIASLEPDQRVTIRYRRDGRMAEATIQAGSVCPPPPPKAPEPLAVPTRVAPLPPEPDEPRRSRGVAVSPRVRVTSEARVARTADSAARAYALATEDVARASLRAGRITSGSPTGRLGIVFTCGECGTRTDPDTGVDVWFFNGPLEVSGVTAGGPADKAGIELGDLIKGIDGKGIDTDEGGLAFTNLEADRGVVLTIVKRNGSEVEVGLVPEARWTVGVRAPEPPSRPSVTSPSPPTPERPDTPGPAIGLRSPEGMPLRYSGTMEGVEVEVRGNPVMVSELRGERVLLINAEGLWIRITIPRGGEITGVEAAPLVSPIRR